jgi:phage shock protein A
MLLNPGQEVPHMATSATAMQSAKTSAKKTVKRVKAKAARPMGKVARFEKQVEATLRTAASTAQRKVKKLGRDASTATKKFASSVRGKMERVVPPVRRAAR